MSPEASGARGTDVTHPEKCEGKRLPTSFGGGQAKGKEAAAWAEAVGLRWVKGVCFRLWVLETKPRSPAGAISAFNF